MLLAPATMVGASTMITMETDVYNRLVGGLNASRKAVLEALREHGDMTDEELARAVGSPAGTVRARRSELVRRGLVREVGRRPTPSGRTGTRMWGIVPPDEVEQAAEDAERRGPRRLDLTKLPLDQRVDIARALLRDRDVNDELRSAAAGAPSSRRVRARARAEQERAQRERAEQIRRAQEDRSEIVAFLKAADHLKRNVEALREVGRFLDAELERYMRGDATQIPDWAWKRVLTQVDDSMEVAKLMRHRIGRELGDTDRSGVVILDGEDISIEHAKLVGGGGGQQPDPVRPIGDASTET